jgi:LytS/YehU family sensor histidine kinase
MALWGWQRERRGLLALAQERALEQAQAQRREAEMRLSVLAAQVEPHFLFNTLAGVRSAISTDPRRASEMIDRLVDYLRASIPRLRSDGSALSTVAGPADSVRAYLALMTARMPRLHAEIDVPPDLAHARCPPLMLISLAENAIKHGVEPKMGPAHVRFAATRDPQASAAPRLLLTIEDDGVGFGEATSGSGIGLTNIRERLAQLYGGRAELRLAARPGGGVVATLSLPLEFDPD